MGLFSRKKDESVPKGNPVQPTEFTIVFEVEPGYDEGHLLRKAKPVMISVDGAPAVSLLAGESVEVKVMSGKRKFKISHKDGTSSMSRNIDGNEHCFIKEGSGDETEIVWGSGGGMASFYSGQKKASAGSKEVTLFFRAEAGLTGRDRKVDISIDGMHVATLGTGERYQHKIDTGTHTFQFNDEFSRQVVQADLGCFIELGRKVEFRFFDPKSLMAKNML